MSKDLIKYIRFLFRSVKRQLLANLSKVWSFEKLSTPALLNQFTHCIRAVI